MNFKINQVFSELVVDLHPKYPIKGHADLVLKIDEDGNERIILIDIKTINAFSYSKKFGRKPDPNAQEHHKYQVGTYAMGIEQMFGKCDAIFILYYKKDNSFLRLDEVDHSYIDKARGYWDQVLLEEKDGLPKLKDGISPKYAWECKYCRYVEQCTEDSKKGK